MFVFVAVISCLSVTPSSLNTTIGVNAPQAEPTTQEEYDEYLKGAIEYYKSTGNLTPYLEAHSVDYDKLSDKEIYAKELRSKYPSISEKAFEKLLDKDLENHP